MRSDMIVGRPPMLDGCTTIAQACEPVEIETVLSKLAIEALDERVLCLLTAAISEHSSDKENP